MLDKSEAVSTFSVRDRDETTEFYGTKLGIPFDVQYEGFVIVLHLAGRDLQLYVKGEDHEPASFTLLDFTVDDIQATVTGLTERGVAFERIDGFEMDANGVHHAPGHDVAWFKDPSGNTLCVHQVTE